MEVVELEEEEEDEGEEVEKPSPPLPSYLCNLARRVTVKVEISGVIRMLQTVGRSMMNPFSLTNAPDKSTQPTGKYP